ncbi:hypothetical protein DIPPA_13379 [Diplonema papillatum]|nr:hypothetical protein DIPPA_13391 [Diplonema papillatum]KAJ9458294.1 hypothetical protein DIPPA_13358 [Diplonema papillatum]KAJ9458295.1 hypothetical protein DIPPA_13355 [Diplonema papillatum]KAJ9458296.1 hypothetical protein DIPPA_13385 [Diplonema papillatum]KAJ9458297.1 hypothetical protein DIPPA_13367 [Diplonema papillatum]
MSTALLLSLVLSSAEFSLEAPSLMKCDGTDFSAGVHPRYAFALAPGKSEYTLKWAVSVKGGAANGTLATRRVQAHSQGRLDLCDSGLP